MLDRKDLLKLALINLLAKKVLDWEAEVADVGRTLEKLDFDCRVLLYVFLDPLTTFTKEEENPQPLHRNHSVPDIWIR